MHCLNPGYLAGFLALALASPSVMAKDKSLAEHSRLITAAIDGGRLTQAAAMISKIGSDLENAPEVAVLQAELALAKKRNAQALELFRNHLDHPALACRAHEGMGISLVRQGEMLGSIEHLAEVTLRCPDRWKSWNTMGVVLSHLKRWQASEHAFRQAVTLSNRTPVTLNNFGYSLMTQKKFREAREYFAEALEQQPDNIQYQNNLDIVQAALGQNPVRVNSQSERRWIERLNNSGHAARLAGHDRMGVALLTEAVLISRTMASTAAKNLNFEHSGDSNP